MANELQRTPKSFSVRLSAILLTLSGVLIPYGLNAQERPHSETPLLVVKDGKYGYIDKRGNLVIAPQFIWSSDFIKGFATAYVCGKYVSVDIWGAILPWRPALTDELRHKEAGGKFGFIDSKGQFRIPPVFDDALPFSEGLAAVQLGEKWGFINESGKMVIQPRFDSAFYFHQDVAITNIDESYAVIDKTGNILADGFSFVELVAEGRIPATRNQKSGYLDLRGNIAIPFVYKSVTHFSQGLAAVTKRKKWGYIDRAGNVVIPFNFDQAGAFGSGLAAVKTGTRSGFIDKSGNFAFDLAFENASGFFQSDENDLFLADGPVSRFWTKDNLFGYVNTAGKVIWGPTTGSPDHAPLFGWIEEDKVPSCEGIPEPVKKLIAGFPPNEY